MVSRVLGLGRDMLVNAVFGAGALASSFYTAFTLPNLFRRLLGEGALTAAFIPTLNEELKSRQRAGAFALVNSVTTWLFVVSASIVVFAMVTLMGVVRFSPELTRWGIEPETAERWAEAAKLAVILFPYLVFVCLAAVFSAALQTLHRFIEPALSPIWLNVAMITLLGGAAYAGWAGTEQDTMLWLCAGALLGGLLQMIVPAVALMREGWRPRVDFTFNDPLRQIIRLMAPTVFGSAIYLINISVSKVIGLSINEAAVAVLNIASRLMELPIGVFAVAVSTVVFPLISKYAAAGDWKSLALSYRKGMRLILVINIPAAVGLGILATPIVRLLFERGAFTAEDTAMVQPVLIVFALGLPFFSFVSIVLRAFYAQKDTTTPMHAALVSFGVNIVASLALMGPLGTVGLAIASNIAVIVQAVYLQVKLAWMRDGLEFGHVRRDLVKILLAAAAMGAVVGGTWWGWTRFVRLSAWSDAFGLLVVIVLGVGVYGAILWSWKIEGRDDLAAIVSRFRRKSA